MAGHPPPGHGPDPYGPPIPFRAPFVANTPGKNAYWAFGLAIASFIACGCVTAIPAFIMARAELEAIKRGESAPSGKSLAQIAYFIGLFNIVVSALLILGYVLALVFSGQSR